MNKVKNCITCGNAKVVAKSLCKNCYALARRKRLTAMSPDIVCKICGKKFKSIKKPTPTHCSKICVLNDPKIRQKLIKSNTKETKMVPCSNCGKLIKRTKSERKKSKHLVCSKTCEKIIKQKEYKLKRIKLANTPCSNDDCNNVGVYRRGLCKRCHAKWVILAPENRSKHVGICPVCGKEFLSYYKSSTYCSNECYVKSDVFQQTRQNFIDKCKKARIDKKCLNCGTMMKIKPSEETPNYARQRKSGSNYKTPPKRFCCRSCFREYFASRYERHIAQTSHLHSPECYDSFLSQEELPCLVDGCDWVGLNLSMHMNSAHGIRASELKALAGFNRKTGVITTKLSKVMGKGSTGNKDMGILYSGKVYDSKPIRPEGREHMRRARALSCKE